MPFISLILVLALIGVIGWAVTAFIPMPPNISKLIIVVCGIVAVLYVLWAFGLIASVRLPVIAR
jgi:hypothetical protein